MTVVSTPSNNMAGNDQSSDEIGSVFIDGKRRSMRTNFSYSADGISAADELVMDKGTRRGISMGSTPKTIKVSYNALKHIEIDKIEVQPKAGRTSTGEVNPFSLSDGEDSEDDSSLLSHLVKDITDVDLDDLDLGKICDLKVSGRKSKSSSKKEKA